MLQKSCPGRLKRHPIPMSQGPWTASPKSKISRTRNNYLSKKQEHLLIRGSISETLSWNGLFSSSRYSTSDLNWQFIFDLLHLWDHLAGDLTHPGQRPGELYKTTNAHFVDLLPYVIFGLLQHGQYSCGVWWWFANNYVNLENDPTSKNANNSAAGFGPKR